MQNLPVELGRDLPNLFRDLQKRSNATQIQYVFVDKITGNESNGYISSDVAKKAIKQAERSDKDAGIYEPDNYYIQRIEVMKGTNRSSKYRGW